MAFKTLTIQDKQWSEACKVYPQLIKADTKVKEFIENVAKQLK